MRGRRHGIVVQRVGEKMDENCIAGLWGSLEDPFEVNGCVSDWNMQSKPFLTFLHSHRVLTGHWVAQPGLCLQLPLYFFCGHFTKFLKTNYEKRCVPQPSLGFKHRTWTHSSVPFSFVFWLDCWHGSYPSFVHTDNTNTQGDGRTTRWKAAECLNDHRKQWHSGLLCVRENISMILNSIIIVFLGYSPLAWSMIQWSLA